MRRMECMGTWFGRLLVCAAILQPVAARSGDAVEVGPSPDWIEEVEAPFGASPLPGAGGLQYLLRDEQHRVEGDTLVRYRRDVQRVRTAGAVPEVSEIRIDFDPQYEQVTFHHLRVLRDGAVREALALEEVKLLQQERDLDDGAIYTGELTALVFVPDVRPGDAVDVAWSIDGANPSLGGRYASWVPLAVVERVERLHFRLLWPEGRALQVERLAWAPAPTRTAIGRFEVWSWDRSGIPGLLQAGGLPEWYATQDSAYLNEVSSWAEVATWAAGLFERPGELPKALEAELARWRTLSAREQVESVLRFVQDEIRYLGLELGAHAFLPHTPAEVIERRYGDCKDKSLLLVTLLRRLGIDADPALVHTRRGARLDERLPSQYAFDHAIARVRLDGRTYWLDGTAQTPGPLEILPAPPFGWALVARRGVEKLERIAPWTPEEPTIFVTEHYARADLQTMTLRIEEVYTGPDAHAFRAQLSRMGLDRLGGHYAATYGQNHPGIELSTPPTVEDSPETGRLVVNAAMRFPVPKEGLRVSARVLLATLSRPVRAGSAPLPAALPHPAWVRHVVEIDSDAGFERFSDDRETVKDGNVDFNFVQEHRGARGRLSWELRTLRDHVPGPEVQAWLETLTTIEHHLGGLIARAQGVLSNEVKTRDLVAVAVLLALGLGYGLFSWARGALRRRRSRTGREAARRASPGSSPELPIRIGSRLEIRAHLGIRTCRCGALLLPGESLDLTERGSPDLIEARLTCPDCGRATRVFFERRALARA